MRPKRDLLYAWLAATVLSGIPSTLFAVATGADPLEATRAAGAMVARPDSIVAAGAVHFAVSLFWASVLWLVLPRRHTTVWALAAAAAIAASAALPPCRSMSKPACAASGCEVATMLRPNTGERVLG